VSALDPLPRTLVRVPSWLGDLVAAEPVLRRLCAEYERAGQAQQLSLAGPGPLLKLFDGRWPWVQRIAHSGRGGETPRAWRGHQRALLLTGSFRSAWVAWRAGIPERIGLERDGRTWLLTQGFAPARAGGRAVAELRRGARAWPLRRDHPGGHGVSMGSGGVGSGGASGSAGATGGERGVSAMGEIGDIGIGVAGRTGFAGFAGRAAVARAPGRANWASAPRWLTWPTPALPRPVGAAYVELLGLLGLSVTDSAPRLDIDPAARRELDERLSSLGLSPGQPYLLACVGGRPGSAKSLEPETAAALLSNLAAEFHWPLLLTAGPGEEPQVAATHAALAARGQPALLAFDRGLSTLSELIGLCQQARLVLTTDSGPRHVARAAGARCLVLFGPMDPRHSVEHAHLERGLWVDLPCRPCGLERCPLPEPHHRACLRRQTPQSLLQAARELLDVPNTTAAPNRNP
jgi:ADP-heptose:LPS heptosyltransferase